MSETIENCHWYVLHNDGALLNYAFQVIDLQVKETEELFALLENSFR
jgi:hypothetical protein